MIYFVIFFINSLLSIITQFFNNRKLTFLFACILLVVLIIFGGLRYDTGYDYFNYEYLYNSYILYNSAPSLELGFKGLMRLTDFINPNFRFFLFIITVIIVGFKGKFILKYSYIPIFSILIYYSRIYLNSDFGQVRQGFAMIFVLYSLVPVMERNLKKFLLLIFLGILFHVSSIFFFPVYFFVSKSYSVKKLLIILGSSFIFLVVNFKDILSRFVNDFPSFISSKILNYSISEADLEIGITFSLVFRILILFLVFGLLYNKIRTNKYELTVFNIYYLGVVFYIIFNSFPQLSGRGSLYFLQFEILLFPIILKNVNNIFIKTAFFLIIMFYCYWGIQSIIDSQPESFIPYKNLLFYDFVR